MSLNEREVNVKPEDGGDDIGCRKAGDRIQKRGFVQTGRSSELFSAGAPYVTKVP